MDLSEYQLRTRDTAHYDGTGPDSLVLPALGLVCEAGSLVNIFRKYLRDALPPDTHRDFIRQEIGDILWYLANIATRLELDLSEIAEDNLAKVLDRYGPMEGRWSLPTITKALDEAYPEAEKFPRTSVFRFDQITRDDGKRVARMFLVDARPNAFPGGAIAQTPDLKRLGFTLGDPLNDNAHTEDNYRFHDAFHIVLMAVLGWSPVMRHLLRIKRKSRPDVDEAEDGNRARDIEEGLSTYLFERSRDYAFFQDPRHVDNKTLDHVRVHTGGLEVARMPTWLWKEAISEGFRVWHSLAEHGGGYVVARLDDHKVEYSKLMPNIG